MLNLLSLILITTVSAEPNDKIIFECKKNASSKLGFKVTLNDNFLGTLLVSYQETEYRCPLSVKKVDNLTPSHSTDEYKISVKRGTNCTPQLPVRLNYGIFEKLTFIKTAKYKTSLMTYLFEDYSPVKCDLTKINKRKLLKRKNTDYIFKDTKKSKKFLKINKEVKTILY